MCVCVCTALSAQIKVADRPVTQQGLGGLRTGSKGTTYIISNSFSSENIHRASLGAVLHISLLLFIPTNIPTNIPTKVNSSSQVSV